MSAGSSDLLVVLNSSISSVSDGRSSCCAVMRPDQRDGFAEIADIVVAHARTASDRPRASRRRAASPASHS